MIANAQVPRDAYLDYTRSFFTRWAPVYDLFGAAVRPVYRKAVERIAPAPGRSVLDLCAGTGAIAALCARHGSPVVAADICVTMLARARRKLPGLARLAIADARRLPFADRSFDVAALSFALHDMPRRVRIQALGEAARVARERLVIVDYDFSRLRLWRAAAVRLVSLFETAYFPPFAAGGVDELLDEIGLDCTAAVRGWPGFCTVYDVPLEHELATSGGVVERKTWQPSIY